MRTLTALTAILLFTSCYQNSGSYTKEYELKQRVDSLEKRFDSLIRLLNKPVQSRVLKQKKNKKGVIDTPIPLGGVLANNPVKAIPLEKKEYTPLKIKSEKATSYKNPRFTPAYSSQCMATTKKGSRCSRASRSGGYCWQHGG